eukprot:gb/GECH01012995.1/.p1 GENE.gb/GECH01012995.1/~~gb/GECH01012995.1/.p1  ORF type:complete len:870 (+),score=262.70 gb/GECH01012995.1/:1-2610(+)
MLLHATSNRFYLNSSTNESDQENHSKNNPEEFLGASSVSPRKAGDVMTGSESTIPEMYNNNNINTHKNCNYNNEKCYHFSQESQSHNISLDLNDDLSYLEQQSVSKTSPNDSQNFQNNSTTNNQKNRPKRISKTFQGLFSINRNNNYTDNNISSSEKQSNNHNSFKNFFKISKLRLSRRYERIYIKKRTRCSIHSSVLPYLYRRHQGLGSDNNLQESNICMSVFQQLVNEQTQQNQEEKGSQLKEEKEENQYLDQSRRNSVRILGDKLKNSSSKSSSIMKENEFKNENSNHNQSFNQSSNQAKIRMSIAQIRRKRRRTIDLSSDASNLSSSSFLNQSFGSDYMNFSSMAQVQRQVELTQQYENQPQNQFDNLMNSSIDQISKSPQTDQGGDRRTLSTMKLSSQMISRTPTTSNRVSMAPNAFATSPSNSNRNSSFRRIQSKRFSRHPSSNYFGNSMRGLEIISPTDRDSVILEVSDSESDEDEEDLYGLDEEINSRHSKINSASSSLINSFDDNRFSRSSIAKRQTLSFSEMSLNVLSVVIHNAAESGDVKKIRKLIHQQRPLNIDDLRDSVDHSTALHKAAKNNQVEVIRELFGLGANLESKDKLQATPLFFATSHGCLEATSLLLALGAQANIRELYGYSPLHLALRKNYLEVAEQLMLFRADVNMRNPNDGNTPLHLCVNLNNIEGIQLLLSRDDIHVNTPNNSDETALHLALKNGDLSVVEEIISTRPKSIKKRNGKQQNVLHLATMQGLKQIFLILVSYMSSACLNEYINEKDEIGYTCLHWAVEQQQHGMVELLAQSEEVDLNGQETHQGNTPLHIALAIHGETNLNMAKILFGFGARTDIKNDNKETAKKLYKQLGIKFKYQ